MLKYLFLLLIGSVMIFGQKVGTRAEIREALKGFTDACDPQPTESDFDDLFTHNRLPSKSAKCLKLCLLNQISILKDNKLDVDAVSQFVGMAYTGEEKMGTEVAVFCNGVVHDEDKCDAAHNYGQCIRDELISRGKKIPEVKQ